MLFTSFLGNGILCVNRLGKYNEFSRCIRLGIEEHRVERLDKRIHLRVVFIGTPTLIK